jgi:type VI secretion system protein ImpA
MRYDFLAEPVSEAEPCGPDLEESFDPDYANVTAEASGLIPQRFYDRGREKVFDRSIIDLPAQQAAITGLLKRSRDIRLLVLDARLQLLAGKLIGFSEALSGLVIVVTTFWDQFHPQPFDGDMIVRQNTLEGLDDLAVVVPALQSASVLEGRARITYRNYLVAYNVLEPWPGEEPMNRDTLDRSLRDEQSKEQLTAAHVAVLGSLEALTTLRNTFIEKAGHVNAPAFDKVVQALTGFRGFLEDYLGITDAAAQAAAAALAAEGGSGETAAVTQGGPIATHAAAMSALKAAEDYFIKFEPSSPAVILIHQARLLIGRPLIAALDALLPEPAARAALRFEGGFRFDLDLARMRHVTDDMLAAISAEAEAAASESSDSSWGSSEESSSWDSASSESTESEEQPADESSESPDSSESQDGEEAPAETPPPHVTPPSPMIDTSSAPSFSATTRQEASQLLSAVEGFFKVVEPSSPVALLLTRARSYFGKDFTAILNELLPPLPPSE